MRLGVLHGQGCDLEERDFAAVAQPEFFSRGAMRGKVWHVYIPNPTLFVSFWTLVEFGWVEPRFNGDGCGLG